MENAGDDRLIRTVTILSALRGGGAESTIQEHWSDPLTSRHAVRIRQWKAAILGLSATAMGLVIAGAPLLLSGTVSTWSDALLVGVFAGLGSVLIWAAVELSMKEYTRPRRIVVAGMGITLVLAGLMLGTLKIGHASWWHPLLVLFGLCVAGPSAALAFNQLFELVDPMGWLSPFEQRSLAILEKLLGGDEPKEPKVVERPTYRWRHADAQGIGAVRSEDESTIEVPATDDLNLADFLEEALSRGLGRAAWLGKGKGRYILPTTGERVTRSTYDRMVQRAEFHGYIRRGGDGDAAEWLTEPEDAYTDWCERLKEEWPGVLVDEED